MTRRILLKHVKHPDKLSSVQRRSAENPKLSQINNNLSVKNEKGYAATPHPHTYLSRFIKILINPLSSSLFKMIPKRFVWMDGDGSKQNDDITIFPTESKKKLWKRYFMLIASLVCSHGNRIGIDKLH